jgi:hypothetical protein
LNQQKLDEEYQDKYLLIHKDEIINSSYNEEDISKLWREKYQGKSFVYKAGMKYPGKKYSN